MLSNCILLIVRYNCYQTSTLLVLLAVAKLLMGQECISVECVPSAAVAVSEGRGCLSLVSDGGQVGLRDASRPRWRGVFLWSPLGRPPKQKRPWAHPPGRHPCPVHAGILTPMPSACWDTHSHPQCILGCTSSPWTDRRLWKHFLSATTVADGKYWAEFHCS